MEPAASGVADRGPQAISMHQPWASLLVFGIKRIEGRSWSTKLRGKLWVHATSQRPTEEVIKETEENFRGIWGLEGVEPTFPQSYPTSALIGCVEIVDCLSVECIEAWPGIPESVRAEVGSPFGFLCENPKYLVVPQKMPGSQKIWSISAKMVSRLEPALKPAPMVGREAWTWTAFEMPESLRTAQLPRSANRHKWAARYGSPAAKHPQVSNAVEGFPGGASTSQHHRSQQRAIGAPATTVAAPQTEGGEPSELNGKTEAFQPPPLPRFRPQALALASDAASPASGQQASTPHDDTHKRQQHPSDLPAPSTNNNPPSTLKATTMAERLKQLHPPSTSLDHPPSGRVTLGKAKR